MQIKPVRPLRVGSAHALARAHERKLLTMSFLATPILLLTEHAQYARGDHGHGRAGRDASYGLDYQEDVLG